MNATCTRPVTQQNGTTERAVRPYTDIFEMNDAWLLVLDVPGADESSTDISVEKQVLTIKATVDQQAPEGYERIHAESVPHRFERSFRLPEQVDTASIAAIAKNGVLRITLPKTKEAQPHKVEIKAG